MRNITTILLFVLCCSTAFAAGPVKVSGRVADSGGQPLPYATVVVKGKMTGVTADRNGAFTITLPDSKTYILVASYTGYTSSEAKVAGPNAEPIEFCLTEDLFNINSVVVTGTKTPRLLKDVPVLTRVITSDDILKLDATNISDLLQAEFPAIEFSFKMDKQVSLNLQGFSGTSVLFLVDGERLAGETLDNVDYSRLVMDNIERVEIVKGAASALYGSNAVGGVVNIITKEAGKPWALNLNARYGTHNAQRYGVTASARQGRVNSVTSFQYDSQNSYSFGRQPVVDITDITSFDGMDGYHTYSLQERLGVTVSDRVKLTAKGGYSFRERNYSESIKKRYRGFTGGLRADHKIDDRQYLEAAYNFDQYDKSDYQTAKKKDIRNYSNRQNTARIVYNYMFEGGHTLTAGIDGMTDYLVSYQFNGDESHEMYSADAFAQFEWKAAPQLDVVAGARLDYFSEIDNPRFTPRLALMYKPASELALRASYGGGFRAPTLKEMYMQFDMAGIFDIYGNPDLKSETSHNFMLSADYTRRYWNASVSGYYNRVSDRITTVRNDALNGMQYTNNRLVDITGLDANLAVKLSCGLGARVSYAYAHESVRKGEINASETRPHSAVFRLEYDKLLGDYGINVMLSGRYMSPLDTNTLTAESNFKDYAPAHYPGYTMWKFSISQKIWRPFTFTCSVDNLFNYKPDHFRYNSPLPFGRTVSIGVSIDFEQLFGK